jgi:hypothetical protein
MNFFRSIEIDPLENFLHLNSGPKESPSLGSLQLDVFHATKTQSGHDYQLPRRSWYVGG